jgi:hypothetical protein
VRQNFEVLEGEGPVELADLAPAVQRHLEAFGEEAVEGAGGGVHELLGDGVGVDPADLGVFVRLAVLGFAGPFVGCEDDGEEAAWGFDAPRRRG